MSWVTTRVKFWIVLLLSWCFLAGCNSTSSLQVNESATFVDLPYLAGTATIQLVINGADIVIDVDGEHAPITAGNFVDLVQNHVYDGASFHRVVRQPEPFVVQGGDPLSKSMDGADSRLGTGNFVDPVTGIPRYIPLEILPEGEETPVYGKTFSSLKISKPPQLPHRRGAIAMARSAVPNSASSQFYIALADLSFLDGEYAVFGYVTQGMEVVDEIQQGDRIQSATVVAGMEHLRRPN